MHGSGMGAGISPAAFLASAFFLLCSFSALVSAQNEAATSQIDVGVILDLGFLFGKRCRTSITMAAEDFYKKHENYSTRIALHFRDSETDVVGAASAALDLVKNVQVKAIIGPQTSTETDFVLELGSKAHVPVVSFSATSPTLSAARTPYFIRTTFSDSSQAGAIAAVIQNYSWREVVLVYEDSEYGSGIVPCLIDALQAVDALVVYRSVIPDSATTDDDRLDAELYKLLSMQTRVFVVHMLPPMGSRFFLRAKQLGLMEQGFAWIVGDGLTDVLGILGPAVISAMEGVIGLRPYVQTTPDIVNFSSRFRARFAQDNPSEQLEEPTMFQWRAYDTTWALAMAVEAVQPIDSGFAAAPSSANNSTDLGRVGVSLTGTALLGAISKTHFMGLAGEFRLVDGQLQSSVYEIVNVIGKSWRGIGFWSPGKGLTKELNTPSDGATGLKLTLWPGDSPDVPRGWQPLVNGKRLRIGVPVKNGFKQFVEVDHYEGENNTNPVGYCIDVFQAVVEQLPFPLAFDYYPFGDSSSSYDNLVYQVYLKKFDAVVGDTTIISNRTQFVDFTLPYTESGVSMVVPVKQDKNKNAWIFLEPLTTDLWLGSLAFFVFTAFVIWVIEHRDNEEFGGTPTEQMGTIFYFTFSILVFAHKEKIKSNLSRVLVIIWVFVVLILTSSYTASLTSMLTVQQLQPTITDLGELLKRGSYVGHQDGSFVVELLKKMGVPESKLRNYSTVDQYAEALSKGSANGGVDAIFDEIPYLKVFLYKYCSGFTMVGRTYKTDGFGFVFPRGSPLVSDISRAILNVTEGDKMTVIEDKWFMRDNCPNESSIITSSSLSFSSFGGLFLITGVVSTLALLVFSAMFVYREWNELRAAAARESSTWRKIVAFAKHYEGSSSMHPQVPSSKRDGKAGRTNEELHRTEEAAAAATLPEYVGSQSPVSISNHSAFILSSPDDGLSSPVRWSPSNSPKISRTPPGDDPLEMADIRGSS